MSTRILAIDTATEACSVAVWNQGEIHALFELCPREHTQRIYLWCSRCWRNPAWRSTSSMRWPLAAAPAALPGYASALASLRAWRWAPICRCSAFPRCKPWRRAPGVCGAERVLAAIDARMGEVYWGQFERQADGSWLESEGEAVLSPAQALECAAPAGRMGPRRHRLANLSRSGQGVYAERA